MPLNSVDVAFGNGLSFQAMFKAGLVSVAITALLACACGAEKSGTNKGALAPSADPASSSGEPASPTATSSEAPPDSTASAGVAPPAPPAKGTPAKGSPAAPSAVDSNAAGSSAEDPSATRERQILYRTTPQGLVVKVEGAEFRPKAVPFKLKNGAYGVRLSVEVKAVDDSMHTLLSPKRGPLSVAGRIKHKSGEVSKFGDEREGNDEQFVTPGDSITVTREWPNEKGGPFLWYGEELVLEVGLWGLGTPELVRRPLHKLFAVRFIATSGAAPVVTPPEI